MNEPAVNRYAPPQAQVDGSAAEAGAASSARLPVLLVLRWALSVWLVGLGLWRLLLLAANWRFYTDRMIIDRAYNPMPWLVLELSVLATGVLLALRMRWVFVPLLLHIGLFIWQIFGGTGWRQVPALVYPVWAVELLVFGFCAWLWLQRRLK